MDSGYIPPRRAAPPPPPNNMDKYSAPRDPFQDSAPYSPDSFNAFPTPSSSRRQTWTPSAQNTQKRFYANPQGEPRHMPPPTPSNQNHPIKPPSSSERPQERSHPAPTNASSSKAPLSMNGIEPVIGPESIDSDRSTEETALSFKSNETGTGSSNKTEAYSTALQIIKEIKRKSTLIEDAALMIKRLETAADKNFRRTYIRGSPSRELYENAPTIKVGIAFLPGSDRHEVTMQEQNIMMGSKEPSQLDAMWRVTTAGNLLLDFEVTKDLGVISMDQTSAVLDKMKERLYRQSVFPPASPSDGVVILKKQHPAVNIDSEEVKIVYDLREHRGEFDLESMLIEVDASSMLNLIVQFRLIIQHKNPAQDLDETMNLLEMMMEDVRRLCHRSPILFRMSNRVKIITSKNTRYGSSNGRQFTTLMTSKGIKEIIQRSAAYYSALDSAKQSVKKAQEQIRPRFLQMLVLLLSFLNDDDLQDLRSFLEETFHFKADRPNLELLFLKVIPFFSINSKVFLTAMVPAFEGYTPREPENRDYAHWWDVFVTRILPLNYILPGTLLQLGREKLSWVVTWPKEGFKSSEVFRNLQYGASDNMTSFNDIPPIEDLIDKEDSKSQLTVVLTNDEKVLIRVADIDPIICLTRGLYTVQEAQTNGRRLDLLIQEEWLNEQTVEAMRRINSVIRSVNDYVVSTPAFMRRVSIRLPRRLSSIPGVRKSDIQMLNECRVSGKLTKHTARLGHQILAITYKLDGRKITLDDATAMLGTDNQEIQGVVDYYLSRLHNAPYDEANVRLIQKSLTEVTDRVNAAETRRQQILQDQVISDEPISTVIQPGGSRRSATPAVWNEYRVDITAGNQLRMMARKAIVSSIKWLSGDAIEVTLQGDSLLYFVTPLERVAEGHQEDQVREGDVAVLAGQYIVISEPDDDEGSDGLFMTNYLLIVRVEEQQYKSVRGRNRQKPPVMTTCLFV